MNPLLQILAACLVGSALFVAVGAPLLWLLERRGNGQSGDMTLSEGAIDRRLAEAEHVVPRDQEQAEPGPSFFASANARSVSAKKFGIRIGGWDSDPSRVGFPGFRRFRAPPAELTGKPVSTDEISISLNMLAQKLGTSPEDLRGMLDLGEVPRDTTKSTAT